MKILVLSQFYTPDITAAAFRVSETVYHLRQLGNDVKVITSFPHKTDLKRTIASNKNDVYRVKLPNIKDKGFIGYIYLYFSFLIKSLIKGFLIGRKQKPDILWATSPPIFVGLGGWILSKLLGVSFALDIRDIWPDSAVSASQITQSGIAYKMGRGLEKFLYRNADLITCVAQPMKRYIQKYTDVKVEVIYNGAETSIIDHDNDLSTYTDKLNQFARSIETKKILYAGNLGHVQQLSILIKSFEEIKDELEYEWEIFFLGQGAQKKHLVNLVEKKNLDSTIHFLNPVSKEEIYNYLLGADALFIHLLNDNILRLTIPSKVFDYMLVDSPLLVGIHGEGKEILETIKGNVVFKPGNKSSLNKALKELEKVVEGNIEPNNSSKVRDYYSRQVMTEKLSNVFSEVFT